MYTRNDAANFLGCTVSLLNKLAWINPAMLPYTKIGRHCMYKKEDLEKYLETKTHGKVQE